MDTRTVGLLGAGQLGRMFVQAAHRLNVRVLFLDVGDQAPAKQIAYEPGQNGEALAHVDGSFADSTKIEELARKVDVLTVEIEHVDADQLQKVLDKGLVQAVHPSPQTLKTIQDKYQQKVHLASRDIPVAEYLPVEPDAPESSAPDSKQLAESTRAAAEEFGLPLLLKSRRQAYDGKGNYVLRTLEEIPDAIAALGAGKAGLYAERMVNFVAEVAVMVVRGANGEVVAYPAVKTVHKDSICHTVFAPLRSDDPEVEPRARAIAERAVATFSGAGVFGVEMFLLGDGELLVNEIAPRPHNSGHYTIEACETSQYENHLRAVMGLPLGSTALAVPAAGMINILGLADLDKDPDALERTYLSARASLQVPGASLHLYGKTGCRKGRKMGHITVVGPTDAAVHARISALDTMQEAGRTVPGFELENRLKISTAALIEAGDAAPESIYQPKSPSDFTHPQPLVGIIMGSDSDLPVMLAAAEVLKDFGVPFELTITSAHRTPDRMREYARGAASRGLRAIIAGAGGAAHLPGMVAAQTALPVIGVPVKGSTLDGVDSLHSIVQMPRGIPVATVAINNAMNAGLLAVRILGAANSVFQVRMQKYMDEMCEGVYDKVSRLEDLGWDYTVKK